MGKRSEVTEQDRKRLALLDPTEVKNFAKELGKTPTEVMKAAMSVRSGGTVEHNKQKIRDYFQAQKDQQSSILPEDSDENAEVW